MEKRKHEEGRKEGMKAGKTVKIRKECHGKQGR